MYMEAYQQALNRRTELKNREIEQQMMKLAELESKPLNESAEDRVVTELVAFNPTKVRSL